MSRSITLLVDGRSGCYDRDKLATAIIIYLDTEGGFSGRAETAIVLRREHGWLDSLKYAHAAAVAVDEGIEP